MRGGHAELVEALGKQILDRFQTTFQLNKKSKQ
jgi:hypothetical protein